MNRQCQRKAHKKSLKESDKNHEIRHNITETFKESLKPLTESPKQPTDYNGPGVTYPGSKTGVVSWL